MVTELEGEKRRTYEGDADPHETSHGTSIISASEQISRQVKNPNIAYAKEYKSAIRIMDKLENTHRVTLERRE